MVNSHECPICKSVASAQPDYNRDVTFFTCPVCGRFEYGTDDFGLFDENHLPPYLFYNAKEDTIRLSAKRNVMSIKKDMSKGTFPMAFRFTWMVK